MNGLARFQRPSPSSRFVSTASTSDARQLLRCAMRVLTPGTWRGGILHGKRSKGLSGFLNKSDCVAVMRLGASVDEGRMAEVSSQPRIIHVRGIGKLGSPPPLRHTG